MTTKNAQSPDYGNWVSSRIILAPMAIGIVAMAVSALYWPVLVVGILFLLVAIYFANARRLFSPRGGDIQTKIRQLVLDRLEWDGKGSALDIGCGNGALAIGCARAHPACTVTGIDYWGKNWEYSEGACRKNAEIEGVSSRVTFRKASASQLPFEDETFAAVISNLTFHEVRDSKDKTEVIKEALRVLEKGGSFSFQDLFLVKATYGDIEELLGRIRSWGIGEVKFMPTRDSEFIPSSLKLPFMVGTMGVISGRK